ncbi:UDP-N-acetylmuramoyl-L-alanyl-D-glutamate--2,6-diaminopimelate ligase 1 [Lachnospiraceae bacterium]|uniref:UDP-N-acetylmuramoyl-L-alanyl-D-glutamate--2, 6-diaminopimelate ligase n=1 Tax=Extibacter sp. GGCC_0201 TaxID=2731209 RepID=UPI001AA0BA2E|nr:UDP-N-acetylmuramoyl-L-alanyl-D-glutamate--2,6-diaminopimelate ligase [Extibacter sp. GGCC_0201]MBO1721408.1 UDP-N-acetylmuramoyl-L-alanyl-D-glutamate--2,6-diaminopimelate ligase [Extibacter sp. GGCC_0201]BDF34941.1 UDP-N-acetylmuramoyl-L-alanyl-D-glutamate--2,6-diaminopimelate ligase 1 [Lachnospiraceae bacterium]BDF38943.1 UDP-N-acetylmuramoyl-L-alanyl-D-glutamate--2,6-diaminopimelate ligase 1 [Lachnospiraceae bacterium]
MILTDLLERLEYEVVQGSDVAEVTELTNDSRKVVPGSVFVCISGAVSDGHAYVKEVAEKGAAAVVVEKQVEAPDSVTVIHVDDTRYALALMSAAYFGYPAEKLKVIGITGTKGKTTTTYMVKSILEGVGHKVGLIGTIEAVIGDKTIPASNTTPESYTIHKYFKEMVDAGCDSVVMEVSSQGLMLHRTAGIPFEIGIFTNLGEDHIGPNEHKDFEDYKRCKGILFTQCRLGIANVDDRWFEDVFRHATCRTETFGFSEKADLRATSVEHISRPGYLGVRYHVGGLMDFDVEIDIPGKFSVYNSLTAIAVCRHFNVPEEEIKKALKVAKVKGRIEMVKVSDDFTFMIDYAHNAMSLKSLLDTLRDYDPGRLVTVFGCGGNRSRTRRFEMGEVSGRLADFTVITSDNPRFEEPQAIIDDIITGIEKTDGAYIAICDRKEAIRYAIEHGRAGDVIILAGKGHETYQEIKGVKYDMDDRVLIAEILEEQGAHVR